MRSSTRRCSTRRGSTRQFLAQQNDSRDLAGRGQAAQRALDDHVSVQPARCGRLARRARSGADQRARSAAGDEPSLPPAAVGAHDFSVQPLRRLHLHAATVRDRPGRDQGAVLPQQRRLRRSDLLSRWRFLQPRQHPSRHDDFSSWRIHARSAPEGAGADVRADQAGRPTSTL